MVDDSTKMIHGDIGYDPKSKVVEVEDDDLGEALELVVEVEVEEGIGEGNLFDEVKKRKWKCKGIVYI